MRNPFFRYCFILAGSGGVLLLIALANMLVSPYGTYSGVALPGLEAFRSYGSRTAKAELVRHEDPDAVLLGSSRVEVGLDPTHPCWGPGRTLNLGLSATNLYETELVLAYAARRSRLRRVVLCADFLMFGDRRTTGDDFEKSLFNPECPRAEYELGRLFGGDTTSESLRVLRRWLARKPSRVSRTGQMLVTGSEGNRRRFEQTLSAFFRNPETYGAFFYSSERVDAFERMVRLCRQREIELVVVIPPVHALQLEATRSAGLWEAFESWKRDLTHVLARDAAAQPQAPPVVLWDFTGYGSFCCEPIADGSGDGTRRMMWFHESSHFTSRLGDLVVHRISGREHPVYGRLDDFGRRITSENVSLHLAATRRARSRFARRNPDEIRFVRECRLGTREPL